MNKFQKNRDFSWKHAEFTKHCKVQNTKEIRNLLPKIKYAEICSKTFLKMVSILQFKLY